jgi:protein gp37
MENSKIEWTHHTFNPWIGCTKVSEGCKHCYAETLDKRWKRNNWGPSNTRTRTSDENWKRPLQWNRKAEKEGVRYRVFCASLADVFEHHPDPGHAGTMSTWRDELWRLIKVTPHLDWLLLTKRPENVMKKVPMIWITDWPKNVWIGTSVENQEQADIRIAHLVNIPAPTRFLSIEPMLGSIDLKLFRGLILNHKLDHLAHGMGVTSGIHWVICGGESGHGARPMHPDWPRSLRDQCKAAGVPFLFKQWGEWLPNWQVNEKLRNESISKFTTAKIHLDESGLKYWKVGKNLSGRMLDGVEYNEFPIAKNI